jgi:hypothetical protein
MAGSKKKIIFFENAKRSIASFCINKQILKTENQSNKVALIFSFFHFFINDLCFAQIIYKRNIKNG